MVTVRKASVDDVDAIVKLISVYANRELLLRKSLFKVFKSLQSFFVAEEDHQVVGCASLVVLWKDLAEICSLAVAESHVKRGIGRDLVLECLHQARELKIPQVIVLTYQDHFFESLGFHPVDKDLFPRKLMWECLECPRLEQCDERAYLLDVK